MLFSCKYAVSKHLILIPINSCSSSIIDDICYLFHVKKIKKINQVTSGFLFQFNKIDLLAAKKARPAIFLSFF